MITQTINVTDAPAIIHRQPAIGATFKGKIREFREDGQVLDVSGDTFEFLLEKADGEDVKLLTLGDGIEFDGDGIEWRFEGAETETWIKNAKWHYVLKWMPVVSGDTIFVQAGSVIPRLYGMQD